MRVLLDTHILLWMAVEPEHLSAAEQVALDDADKPLLVSAVSIWELRIKWQALDRNGVRKGLLDPVEALDFIDRNYMLELYSLTGADCAVPLVEPISHRDPFDEMLLTHAQQLGAKLLTRDRALQGHPLVVPL